MIIKALPEHAQVLAELGKETFYRSHKDSAPERELRRYMDKVYTVNAINAELLKPENIYHALVHNEKIVGYSKMQLDVSHPAIALEHASKLDQIYLLDSVHGLKLGAALLIKNIEFARRAGQEGMWLVVWIGNDSAISFYKKFGFSIVREDRFALTENHVSPCYIMSLSYMNLVP